MLVKIVVEPTSKHIRSFIFHSMSYYYLIFNIHLKKNDDLFFSLRNCFICLICHMCILAEISFIISGFRRLPVHLDQSIDITKHMHPLQQDIYCVLGNLFYPIYTQSQPGILMCYILFVLHGFVGFS